MNFFFLSIGHFNRILGIALDPGLGNPGIPDFDALSVNEVCKRGTLSKTRKQSLTRITNSAMALLAGNSQANIFSDIGCQDSVLVNVAEPIMNRLRVSPTFNARIGLIQMVKP